MTWINANIHHFAAPLAMILSIFTVVTSYIGMRSRKTGQPNPLNTRLFRGSAIVFLLICGIVLGLVLANLHG